MFPTPFRSDSEEGAVQWVGHRNPLIVRGKRVQVFEHPALGYDHGGVPFDPAQAERIIRERTTPAPVPLVPEILLYTATALTPLWHATAETLERDDLSPFWAFPWAGGQALARYVLDHPELVRGRAVLDFGAGSGLCGVAALLAGARRALAVDLDPYMPYAARLNAALNGVALETTMRSVVGEPVADFDVVLAGDVFYERALAEDGMRWFAALVRRGATVLVGDPGRIYTPRHGLALVARYDVPTTTELEDAEQRLTTVYRVT
jgi:predicted nicotinamide N-methyase